MKLLAIRGTVAISLLLGAICTTLADSGPMNFIGKWQTDPGGTLGESDGLSWHSTNGNWIAVSDNRTDTRLYNITGFPGSTPSTVRTITHDPAFVLPSPLRQVARGEVNPISFTPDGNWMATGVDSLGTKIWNVNTGAQMQHLGNGTNTDGASFSPTGQYFAYGSDSNLIVRAFDTPRD